MCLWSISIGRLVAEATPMYNTEYILAATLGNMIMETVSFSNARKSLKAILDRVNDDIDCTIITRRDAPEAVLMSLKEYNALLETVHLLDSPANAMHLSRSIEQHKAGRLQRRSIMEDERDLLDT